MKSVRRMALALPGVEEASAYGRSGLRCQGQLFLVFRPDLDSIVLRASIDQREAMIAEDPETFFITDHYRGYPWVLARVSKLNARVLPDLLQMALRAAPPRKAQKKKRQ